MICSSTGLAMSVVARAVASRPISTGSARAQPIRNPPHTDLLSEPTMIVRAPATGAGRRRLRPVEPQLENVSSITTWLPARSRSSSTRRRDGASITAPVGFW